MKPEKLMADLAGLSEEAGRAILKIYSREDFGTTYKDDRTPLTFADRASNRVIVEGLRELYPDIPIVSEELREVPYAERGGWEKLFLVDPLDGTKEFIKRNGEFTVNIALVENGRPTAGVVHAPVLGTTYVGMRGEGAYRLTPDRTEPIRAADYNEAKTIKVVGSRSHKAKEVEELVARMTEDGYFVDFVSMGSSLKLCLVAEGRAHLYPRLGPTMEWDTAAAQAVVESAGGTVTDTEGEPLKYNKRDLHNPFFVVTGEPPFPWQQYTG